ncbi:cytochrome d ubiquinol oxidase subunit II [Streptomyces sp. NPDC005438]|uniref:cytochrome d ubiquinol oxidase subunit II n=1 Tax=Streptomyces sp. NPDC005438 TaxID=3156880 RepID=UPI0033B760B9
MALHDFWFWLIAVLWIGYFFLEGFDFGVGVLTRLLARDEAERRVLINTIGPVWDGNEVWLITAAGATFAAFPDWYALLFSGLYLPLLLILVCLIVRGVSFEYRHQRDDERWKRNWELALFWSSLVPALLWGAVFALMLKGLPIDRDGRLDGGIGALFGPYPLLGGLVGLVLFTFHGSVFAALKTDGDIRGRARALAGRLGLALLPLLGGFLLWTQLSVGRDRGWPTAVLAVLGLAGALWLNRLGREGWAFALSGVSVATLFATVFLGLFPHVLVSSLDPAWSITAVDAASGRYALGVMTWVAVLATPLVLLYQAWTYWVFRRRISTRHLPSGH